MSKHFSLIIGDKNYSPGFQTDQKYANLWQSVLRGAHGNKEVHCRCATNSSSRQLYIRSLSGGAKYSLSRFQKTGPNHRNDCRFYGMNVAVTDDAYQSGVVLEGADGQITVSLEFGQQITDGVIAPGVPPRAQSGKAARLAKMTLRGLMDLLWTHAGLNQFHRGLAKARLKHSTVMARVLQAAETVRWGGEAIESSLVVSGAYPSGGLDAHNKKVLKNAEKHRRRVVLIGQLTRGGAGSGFEGKVSMTGFTHHFQVNHDVASAAEKSFARELNAWRLGETTFAAIIAEPPETVRDAWNARQLVIMRTSERAIPVDSSHELKVEALLVKEGRWFQKPLRYDASEMSVLPDFELLDVHGPADPYPMEVWGRKDEAYLSRKAEKRAYYDATFTPTGWWQWDATGSLSAPTFPLRNNHERPD